VGMLAAALRGYVRDSSFEDLQERLLDALPGHVTGDGRVVRLARDLVDLVDVDDPALGPGDVEVGGLDQSEEDVLDVLPDVASLRERRRIGNAERNVEHAGEGLGEQGLAGPRRPDEQDVRLLELDLVDRMARIDPLVVVVDGHGEDLLGLLLTDHVLVEGELDLAGIGELGARRLRLRRLEHLLFDDLLAQVYALVADVDALAGDQLSDLLLALAAEAAAVGDLGSLRS